MFHFQDNRGSLTSYKEIPFEVKEILDSRSYPNVLRGLHLSPYPKRVCVRKGKIYDFFINPETGQKTERILQKGEYIDIPSGYAHGFYSYEETELIYLLGGSFNASVDRTIYWNDPTLGFTLSFPKYNLILSKKDADADYAQTYEYYVLGARGFLGSYLVKTLKKQGFSVFESNERLENLSIIQEQIVKSRATYVICAAGISGKPTIDWCETHEDETYRSNYLGILNLMTLTKELGLHTTIFGSGQVFQGTKAVYSEEDPADLSTKVYSKWRTQLEKGIPLYENVLYLRIIYPVSLDEHPKCFLNKMAQRASSVHNVRVCLTIIPSLFPTISQLCKNNVRGIMNFVNKGTISLPELLEFYSHTRKKIEIGIQSSSEARGAYELSIGRLSSYINVDEITHGLKKTFY
jgi:dTDP-4-dehydrorhamnose 3,5-epimerase-like enzyme/dTDP-4-dehydrorhamnose reductase